MQLEKEKKEKRERERCRALAQRIAEEANPASAALLGEQMPLLAKALHRAGVEAEEWTESSEAELLVVADPAWETLPETLPARVLLVSDESTVRAGPSSWLSGDTSAILAGAARAALSRRRCSAPASPPS